MEGQKIVKQVRVLLAEDQVFSELPPILEAVPAAVLLTDERGQIISANAQVEEMFGYCRDELLGQAIEMLLPERFRQVHLGHRAGYFAEPRTRLMGSGLELCGLRKDGSEFPVEIGLGSVMGESGPVVMSFVTDVSERKQIEENVRNLSRAVEQSPSMVVITDVQGNIEYANPKFTDMTGYTLEEVSGQNPRLLKSGQQPPEFYRELWHTIQAGGEWRGEFNNRRKDGELYWEFASISPIRNGRGEIRRYLKVAEDITARKRAEEASRRYASELEERNKELDAFAHTVAHDLKNPLGVMVGFAEVLAEDIGSLPAEQMAEYLGVVARSGRKMRSIVEELLLLASVREVDVDCEPLDMAEIVADAQSRLVDMIAEYGAEIVLPAVWPAACGHAPWVEEVWVNYISNAFKYGGCPPRVELGATVQPHGLVLFWVRDNGLGLKPDEMDRLFVPFTRLAQARAEGHGLGLSIVRRIVEKLGGRVTVESDGVPGAGSTFGFTLPAWEDLPD